MTVGVAGWTVWCRDITVISIGMEVETVFLQII